MKNLRQYPSRKIIVAIKYGSHLYGTNTAHSDLDIKGVFLPSAQEILLQKVPAVISINEPKKIGKRNTPEDIDYDLYNPAKFLHSVAKGQSFALEMLFAPDSALIQPADPIWFEIKKLAMQLLTQQAGALVSYCKQQAYKYSKKGSNLATARQILTILIDAEKKYGTTAKLHRIEEPLKQMAQKNKSLHINSITQSNGKAEWYLDICGKKLPFSASLKNARLITQNILNQYGERAHQAEENKGTDWKAMSHAVRIAFQAIEFLKHHRLTFPRPERKHLLAIKEGRINYNRVTQEIEKLLIDIDQAVKESALPKTYDPKKIDDLIEKIYRNQVIKEANV